MPVDVRAQRVVGGDGAAAALAYGLLAGAALLVAEVLAALVAGAPPTLPLRLVASVALGSPAVEGPPAVGLLVAGTFVHLALSGLFGWVYGAAQRIARPATRASLARQALGGALFGLALWLLNFQVVARAAYPWLLAPSQVVQALLHALVFGAPLGLLFAASARAAPGPRLRRLRGGRARREEPAAR